MTAQGAQCAELVRFPFSERDGVAGADVAPHLVRRDRARLVRVAELVEEVAVATPRDAEDGEAGGGEVLTDGEPAVQVRAAVDLDVDEPVPRVAEGDRAVAARRGVVLAGHVRRPGDRRRRRVLPADGTTPVVVHDDPQVGRVRAEVVPEVRGHRHPEGVVPAGGRPAARAHARAGVPRPRRVAGLPRGLVRPARQAARLRGARGAAGPRGGADARARAPGAAGAHALGGLAGRAGRAAAGLDLAVGAAGAGPTGARGPDVDLAPAPHARGAGHRAGERTAGTRDAARLAGRGALGADVLRDACAGVGRVRDAPAGRAEERRALALGRAAAVRLGGARVAVPLAGGAHEGAPRARGAAVGAVVVDHGAGAEAPGDGDERGDGGEGEEREALLVVHVQALLRAGCGLGRPGSSRVFTCLVARA